MQIAIMWPWLLLQPALLLRRWARTRRDTGAACTVRRAGRDVCSLMLVGSAIYQVGVLQVGRQAGRQGGGGKMVARAADGPKDCPAAARYGPQPGRSLSLYVETTHMAYDL